MDPNTVVEYRSEDHQVDGYPTEEQTQEPGFFDSWSAIKTDIVDSFALPEINEPVDHNQEQTEQEDKGLFEKLTGIDIFSHSEENGEEHVEPEPQVEDPTEKKKSKSVFKKLTTRFDGKKEEGYDVKSSSSTDEAELKTAPKVSNMVAMFEGMKGKMDRSKRSGSEAVAENEIAEEKRRAKEKQEQQQKPGLLKKLSSFSLSSGNQQPEETPPEPVVENTPEESKGLLDSLMDTFSYGEETQQEEIPETQEEPQSKPGLMDRLAASFSFDAGDDPLLANEEAAAHEVDEASEPSILDQIVSTISGEPIEEVEHTPVYHD